MLEHIIIIVSIMARRVPAAALVQEWLEGL
jgi:hypothetical protein